MQLRVCQLLYPRLEAISLPPILQDQHHIPVSVLADGLLQIAPAFGKVDHFDRLEVV